MNQRRTYRDFDHHEVVVPFLYVQQGDLHLVYPDEAALWAACREDFPQTHPETVIAILGQHGCTVRWIWSDTDGEALQAVLAIPQAEFEAARDRLWADLDRSFPGADLVDWATTKTFIYVDRTRRRRILWCRGDDIDVDLPHSDPRYFEIYDRVTELFDTYGRTLAAALAAEFYL